MRELFEQLGHFDHLIYSAGDALLAKYLTPMTEEGTNALLLAPVRLILSAKSNILPIRLKSTAVTSLIITKPSGNTQRPGLTARGNNRTPAHAGRASTPARLYFNGRAVVGEPQGSPVCYCPGLSTLLRARSPLPKRVSGDPRSNREIAS